MIRLRTLCKLLNNARLRDAVKGDLRLETGRLGGVLAAEHGFLASLPVDSPLGRHSVATFLHADNWEDAEGFDPDVYVPIPEEAFQRWSAAIQGQAFARGETYGFRYIDYYTAMMSARGCLAGVERACGFARGGSSKFELAGP